MDLALRQALIIITLKVLRKNFPSMLYRVTDKADFLYGTPKTRDSKCM